MGLFSKKSPCAICGGKVGGIFPSKIDGQLICSDCHGIVDLPDHVEKRMTLDEFRGYMAFREENKKLKEQFQLTQQVDFGWFDTKFMFDINNRLLCMDKHLEKTIFEGKNIASFVIREDANLLFEGDAQGLRCYASMVPDQVAALMPQIAQYRMQQQLQRGAERLMDRLDGERNDRPQPARQYFDIPEPFKNFIIDIHFDHPYWDLFTADMSGPTFDNNQPDANDYLRRYDENVSLMYQLAQALMALAFPGAPEFYDGDEPAQPVQSAAPTAPATDAVTEIQRYKALLDQGIITEEEFSAKKRQLLGI